MVVSGLERSQRWTPLHPSSTAEAEQGSAIRFKRSRSSIRAGQTEGFELHRAAIQPASSLRRACERSHGSVEPSNHPRSLAHSIPSTIQIPIGNPDPESTSKFQTKSTSKANHVQGNKRPTDHKSKSFKVQTRSSFNTLPSGIIARIKDCSTNIHPLISPQRFNNPRLPKPAPRGWLLKWRHERHLQSQPRTPAPAADSATPSPPGVAGQRLLGAQQAV